MSPFKGSWGDFSDSYGGFGSTIPSVFDSNMLGFAPSTPGSLGNPSTGGFGTGMGSIMPKGGADFGFNIPTVGLGLAGIQTIGNLWAALSAQKLARQQFNFTKDITNTNIANQIKSYNTSLEDRGRSRAFVEGRPQSEADAWVAKNKMTRAGG